MNGSPLGPHFARGNKWHSTKDFAEKMLSGNGSRFNVTPQQFEGFLAIQH